MTRLDECIKQVRKPQTLDSVHLDVAEKTWGVCVINTHSPN